MIATWADYVGYPGGAALRAAGYVGAIRYVGIGSGGKRLTAAELADLTSHGLQVLGVAESTATEANNGYAAGVADARAVLADPVSNGLPFIFATNDQTSYSQADVDYVAGFASVLGPARTGAYGFHDFLTAVRAAGHAAVFWQCGDPPNMTGTQGWVHFWQRQGTPGNGTDGPAVPATVQAGGVNCDINNQLRELPNMTTLDDTVHSGVPGSTVTYPLWQGIVNADAYGFENRATLAAIQTQLSAIQGALGAEEAALLAAVKAVPAASVDATAVAAALDSAGLPAQLAAAFVAVLNKAAGGK